MITLSMVFIRGKKKAKWQQWCKGQKPVESGTHHQTPGTACEGNVLYVTGTWLVRGTCSMWLLFTESKEAVWTTQHLWLQDEGKPPVPSGNRWHLPLQLFGDFTQKMQTSLPRGPQEQHTDTDIPRELCFAQRFLLGGEKKNLSVWKEDLHLQIDLPADPTGSTCHLQIHLKHLGSCLVQKFLYKWTTLRS